MGDAAGPSPRRRRRRVVTAAVVVALVLLAAVPAFLQPRTSGRPMAPDNPGPNGAMAVAEILRDQGVDVAEVDSYAGLTHLAGPGATVFVADARTLRPGQYTELVGTGADVVVGGNLWVDPDVVEEMPIVLGGVAAEVAPAECRDPDAQAASRIEHGSGSVRGGAGVEVCFPVAEDSEAGGYAVWTDGGSTVRYLAASHVMTNRHLAEHGHAALALRMLGHHDEVLWYLPDSGAAAGDGDGSAALPLVPPGAQWVMWTLLAAAAVLAAGRARGLGPVVTEVMPVVVRSAETTRGRGRLYRRGRARDHAAASLRAGTASRVARALGLPRSAGRPTLVDAVARATGRPPADVDHLLYGTTPTDDAGLLTLSAMLDALEREVHRT